MYIIIVVKTVIPGLNSPSYDTSLVLYNNLSLTDLLPTSSFHLFWASFSSLINLLNY